VCKLQNAESSKIFKDLDEDKDLGPRMRTKTRTCKLVLEDPRGRGLSSRTPTLCLRPYMVLQRFTRTWSGFVVPVPQILHVKYWTHLSQKCLFRGAVRWLDEAPDGALPEVPYGQSVHDLRTVARCTMPLVLKVKVMYQGQVQLYRPFQDHRCEVKFR